MCIAVIDKVVEIYDYECIIDFGKIKKVNIIINREDLLPIIY
jgi:hydrogenase maturation factor